MPKRQVEDSLPLRIKAVRPYLQAGVSGWSQWGDSKIGWRVAGDPPAALILDYKLNGEPITYPVNLTFTPTPWGYSRAWWACPKCGRRCGVLYLPDGAKRFYCRLCHNLAYRSTQEEHRSDSLWRMMAAELGGYTPGDLRYMMGDTKRFPRGGRLAFEVAQAMAARDEEYKQMIAAELAKRQKPDYLTAAELCEQSGLTLGDLAAFEGARLLIPDTKDRRYRPKLAGWGRKLAYLLAEGWALPEVAAWARGRWATDNPRAWPPERAAWQKGDI